MIRLGLERISRLLENSPAGWRAIHVAGTNGKGSICAYISALLHAGDISCGRFTSPHLLYRWDCITINEKPVSRRVFEEVEAQVLALDKARNINASEFEILTATAFKIFTRERVEVGVVECGMGGLRDATNVLKDPLITVISRIGLDHQAYLGNTIAKIAAEKAGIIKQGVPCVADGRNVKQAMDAIRSATIRRDCDLFVTPSTSSDLRWRYSPWQTLKQDEYSLNEQDNMQCAATAVGVILPKLKRFLRPDFRPKMLPAMKHVKFPGRLQTISIEAVTGKTEDILLDGAHNAQATTRLATYIRKTLRKPGEGVTWIIAVSKGRADWKLLRRLIKPRDNCIFTTFGPVDGMPWVKPTDPIEIKAVLEENSSYYKRGMLGELHYKAGLSVPLLLQKATDLAAGGQIVVTGSLYLIADILRYLDTLSNAPLGQTGENGGSGIPKQERT